jgi:thiamine biosynthesis lipoprotein
LGEAYLKFIVRHLKLVLTILLIAIIFSGFTLLNPLEEKSTVKTNFLLSTMVSIKAYGNDADQAVQAAMDRIQEIENTMSAYIEGSDIWNVNHDAFDQAVQVRPDTFNVVQRGLYYSRLTNGNFDITVKPLVDLWGINSENPKVPDPQQIDEVIDKIGYQKVQMDEKQNTVRLLQKGTGIDLGGIAKGYAADEAIRVLKEYGIKRAYADLGGNVIVLGKKKIGLTEYFSSLMRGKKVPMQQDWKIGIQDPFKGRGIYMAIVEVSDKAVVTSGPYERNFEEKGKVYHHILDPFTGYPVESGLVSATIIADNSMDADALSTSLFLLGEEKGLQLVESQPGIEAIMINKNKEVRVTKGLVGKIKIVDKEYILK